MIQKIREKLNIQTVIQLIPTVLFLLFIFYVMIHTFTGGVKTVITDTKISIGSFKNLSDSFESTLRENIFDKNNYIDLNGLSTRTLGINSLNTVQKLSNGHLSKFEYAEDYSWQADNVISLNDFLADRGIYFLYLLAPSTASIYDADFAPGYESDSWKNIEYMTTTLNDSGVATIDMNKWFKDNGWASDDVFYKTDHHWVPKAALAAARCTMERLEEDGIAEERNDWLKEENYNIVTLEDWFLGYYGKRTGSLYNGVDDFYVYFPNFETDYSFSRLSNNTTNWSYENSPLNLTLMEEKNYFGSDPHGIYMYSDNPIQILNNSKAYNDKTVLVTGDSFRRSWEYFLSTQFQKIYYMDLRYYTDGTFAQCVSEISPDIVIMCSSEGYIWDKSMYEFGIEGYLSSLENTTTSSGDNNVNILGNISIEAQEGNASNFICVCNNLEPDQTYTLTLDSTKYEDGEDLYIQMTLQNLSSNKAIYNRYFDANSNETQKWIFTTPDDISGVYSIYLYAGTKGHTNNVSVDVSNVRLRKGIFED